MGFRHRSTWRGHQLSVLTAQVGSAEPHVGCPCAGDEAGSQGCLGWRLVVVRRGSAARGRLQTASWPGSTNVLRHCVPRPADPTQSPDDTFSPLSSPAAAEKLAEQIEDAVSKGATMHAGGTAQYGLGGLTHDMRAHREELFGPVAVVYSDSSDEEALALANDSDYGLGGAVYCTDADRATKVASRLEVGMSTSNTPAGEGALCLSEVSSAAGPGVNPGLWAWTSSSSSGRSTWPTDSDSHGSRRCCPVVHLPTGVYKVRDELCIHRPPFSREDK